MSTWLFKTPVVQEGPAGGGPLFNRYKLARGVTIIGDAQGGFRALRFPTQDEININDAGIAVVYLGGHEFVVGDAQRNALIAGGVGVDASNFTFIS